MNLRLHISARADTDLVEIAEYISINNPAAASRSLHSCGDGMKLLARMPTVGPVYEIENARLSGMRKWGVKGFPKYLIFYRFDDHTLFVARVIHGARDLPTLFEGKTR